MCGGGAAEESGNRFQRRLRALRHLPGKPGDLQGRGKAVGGRSFRLQAPRRADAEQGAHHVVDHRNPSYLDEILKLTDGRGVDIILEMLSNVNLGKDLTLLAKYGRVIVIGSRGNVEITPRELMKRDADIRGMTLFNATDEELSSIHAALAAGLENGTLRPVVGREMPMAEASKAHVAVLEPGAYGKIVLIP